MEGTWEWSSAGKQFSIYDWNPGEPDNHGNKDCLQLWKFAGFHWDDVNCSDYNYYICEAM